MTTQPTGAGWYGLLQTLQGRYVILNLVHETEQSGVIREVSEDFVTLSVGLMGYTSYIPLSHVLRVTARPEGGSP